MPTPGNCHKEFKCVKNSRKNEASEINAGLEQLDDLFDSQRTTDSKNLTFSIPCSRRNNRSPQSNVELLSVDAQTPTGKSALPMEQNSMISQPLLKLPQESHDSLNFHSLTPSPANATPTSSNSICSAASSSLHVCNKCFDKGKAPLSQVQISGKQMVSNIFMETKSGSTTGSMSSDPNRVYQILIDELSLHSNNFRKEELISKLNQIQVLVLNLKSDVIKMDPGSSTSNRDTQSSSISPQPLSSTQKPLFFINPNNSNGINNLIPQGERRERIQSEDSRTKTP